MRRKDLFSIGDVARLFHVSVSTLRHYEAAGLLVPEHIDPNSGYRYYSPRQFEPLNVIRYLRALDLPLEQIRDFLQNRELDSMEEKLCAQKEAVAQKRAELEAIERKIDNRLTQLRDARSSELDVIRLQKKPACRLVWLEKPLQIRRPEDLENPIQELMINQLEPLVFLGKVGVGISRENLAAGRFEQYDCVFLILDEVDRYEGHVEELPAGQCVSIRYCGSHRESPAQYRKLMRFLQEHQLEVIGFSREITMIDYGLTRDIEQFVTEISIPVRDACEEKHLEQDKKC